MPYQNGTTNASPIIPEFSWAYFTQQENTDRIPSIERKLSLALDLIEREFTAKFGFLTEVSTDPNLAQSCAAIPNIFDTSVIIDLLHTSCLPVSPEVVECTKKILLNTRNQAGLWNYFYPDYKIIPDDVDASSNAVLALIACGMRNEDLVEFAENVLHKAVIHSDGQVDVYYPKPNTIDLTTTAGKMLEKWQVVRRVDLSVIANLLLLQNILNIEHLSRLSAGYKLLDQVLDVLLEKDYENPLITTHAKNYENLDIVCFFISRLIPVSQTARSLFQGKLGKIFEERIRSAKSDCVISIACRILGGVNSGLLETIQGKKLILKESGKLLDLQKEDYSFHKVAFYNAHRRIYFGSKAMTTTFAIAALAMVKNKIPSFNEDLIKVKH